VRQWSIPAGVVAAAIVCISAWAAASESAGRESSSDVEPQPEAALVLSGPDAEARRRDMLDRAALEVGTSRANGYAASAIAGLEHQLAPATPECQYLPAAPSGTTAKFECVFDGGVVAKVKYGRNPEIHAEVAASRLMHLLGYPSDTVLLLPRLRCHGCPRYPFFAARLRSAFALPLMAPDDTGSGYTDFEWVSLERRFPAPAVETEASDGWAWWELDDTALPRADVDAFRLLAVFLAHWDNKASNQRLVCLDGLPPHANADCARPLALIHDLGATFGPAKVNLARWREHPVWHDRTRCTVSMRALPFGGASFPDAQISEEGRARLAARLAALDERTIAALFAEARFPDYQVGTADERDLAAWVAAFRHRTDQIVNTRCPDTGGIGS
jgi:hypothetical protein